MHKTFTHTSSGLTPIFFRIPEKFHQKPVTGHSKKNSKIKPTPSKLSLQIIMSYAAALQVVKCNEDVSFDLLMN
jgi:hypothetical protein